jgi:parallel beta-helix repeat protein/predicted outer membrane repeat protein
MEKRVLLSFVVLLAVSALAPAATHLVPADYDNIQAAINAAVNGDTVLVADGTYTGLGNRDIEFFGKGITVQSETGADNCIIDCQGTETELHRGFNFSYNQDTNSVINGFTIINGYATSGGGINCRQNQNSTLIITNCNIRNNASFGRGGWGGGISIMDGIYFINNCTINDNSAESNGGGIYCSDSSPDINNCTFSGNSAEEGGGIYSDNSRLTLSNCIISGNYADSGGGMFLYYGDLNVSNCTFTGNSADEGGGILSKAGRANVTDSILWADIPTEIVKSSGRGSNLVLVTYSNVQNGWEGEGNIDTDPCFVEPGFWDVNSTPQDANDDFWVEGDYHLLAASLCIDAGDPDYIAGSNETDIDGDPRIINDRVDIGVDEFVFATPFIVVSEPQLNFIYGIGGVVPEPQSFSIWMNGGTLDCHIEYDCEWVDIELTSPGNSREADEVTVTVNPVGLHVGVHSCLLAIIDSKATNSPKYVQVNLEVKGPLIGFSPTNFYFSCSRGNANPEPQILSIWNDDVDVPNMLNWEIIEDSNWLEVEPREGYSAGEINDVVISVDATGLSPGIHNCVVEICDPNAANNPRSVPVTLFIRKTVFVPSEYETIQAAINACRNEDTVIVADGTYRGPGNRNIDFHRKAITVKSENGPRNCVIDCQYAARGFYFHSRESESSVLDGFTIKRGYMNYGGAIYCTNSSPKLLNCVFKDNRAYKSVDFGGEGGAIYCIDRCKPILVNCAFIANIANQGGGGIYARRDCDLTLTSCTFAWNSAGYPGIVVGSGGGMKNIIRSEATLFNCLFWDNYAAYGRQITIHVESNLKVSYCDIMGGQGGIYNYKSKINWRFGNIDSHPVLVSNDYHLRLGSGCINKGSRSFPFDPNDSDIDGQPRVIHRRVDIGADEYHGDNAEPVADAGEDQVAFAWINGIADVILDGTGSSDRDNHVLTYLWSWTIDGNDYDARGPNPTIELPIGEHAIELIVNDRVEDSQPDEVVITVVPPLEVPMKFTPKALNLSSGGKFLKAHFVLTEGFSVEDVDANTPAVIEPFGVESYKIKVLLDDEGLVRVEATFRRSDLCSSITTYDQSAEVTVTGRLTTGQQFYGTDIIKITNRAFEHLATVVSHWLKGDCGRPDWCGGADLNEDSVVNFLDFARLASCCIEITEE